MISIRINLTAKPGKQLELIQSIRELKNVITKETGCYNCKILQNTENRDELVLTQQWYSKEMAQAHLDSENLAILVGAGSVLSQKVNVTLSKEPSIAALEKTFIERIVKNGT